MQITINACATLEDISEWLAPFAAKRPPLYFALVVYFPKSRVVPLARWERFVERAAMLKADELLIDLKPIPAKTLTSRVLDDASSRERFSINLPARTASGLREAWFGTVATKEKNLKVWRSVIRAIRKHTTGGMWIWNEALKLKCHWDRHRYSPRIAVLHAEGLRLLAFAGSNELFIAEPAARR